jgi:prolyl-tRNA synthetase
VSTRLVGGLIMSHSDDDGLILPPRLAPAHVVILPVFRDDEGSAKVMEYIDEPREGAARSASASAPSRSRSTRATSAAATSSGSG